MDRHKNVSDSKIRPRGDTKIVPISVPIQVRDAPIEGRGTARSWADTMETPIVPISVPIQGRDALLEKVVRNRAGTIFAPIRLYIET